MKSKLSSTASEGCLIIYYYPTASSRPKSFSLIIVSNQAGFAGAKGDKKGAEWKKKVSQIAAQV